MAGVGLSLYLSRLPKETSGRVGGLESSRVFLASRQSPPPSLVDKLDETRAPSLHWRYPTSLVLLAPPTSRRPNSDFVSLYRPFCGHHPRQTRSPAFPSKTSLTSRPDDPGKLICVVSVSSTDDGGLPLLTTRGRRFLLQVTRLYGFLVSTACEFAILRFFSPFSSFPRFGVFSIRSALRVTSQNWIFASGVYRQFPAPGFNRLASPLPRRTVKSLREAFSR